MDKETAMNNVGNYFHSFNDTGEIEWQGQILDEENGEYLVQLFEWICGEPGDQEVVPVSQTKSWRFYRSATAMNRAYHSDYLPVAAKRYSERLALQNPSSQR